MSKTNQTSRRQETRSNPNIQSIAAKNQGEIATFPDTLKFESKVDSGTSSSHMAETTVPNFLLKLWKLVDDPNYGFCIGWDESGTSFHVREPYAFSKDVLPLFFKHSNLNSFIRQLNMYGFRKVTSIEQGALKHQATDMDSLEFHHPYFVRGRSDLLQHIKRKAPSSRLAIGDVIDVHDRDNSGNRTLGLVLDEVRQLREKQFGMDSKLHQLKKENETLWREIAHMRQLHLKQHQIVTKLIQFLLAAVQPSSGGRLGKRNLLAIGSSIFNQHLGDGPNPPSKRLRMNSDDAVNIIESLEQELRKPARRSQEHFSSFSSDGDGPTIADVTDESDALGVPLVDSVLTTGYAISPESNQNETGFVDLNPDAVETTGIDSGTTPLINYVTTPASVPIHQPPQVEHQQPIDQQGPSHPNVAANDRIDSPFLLSPAAEMQEWSKPEFSQYLDYVQTDLDVLKDFLCSEGLDVDSNAMDGLFSTDPDPVPLATPAGPFPAAQSSDIIGNELQVYKPPEMLVNLNPGIDGAATSSMANPLADKISQQLVAPKSEMATPLSFGLEQGFLQPQTFGASAVIGQDDFFDQFDSDNLSVDPITNVPESPLRTPVMSPMSNMQPRSYATRSVASSQLQQQRTASKNNRSAI